MNRLKITLLILMLFVKVKLIGQNFLQNSYLSLGWNYSNQSPDTLNLFKFVDRRHNINSVYYKIGHAFKYNNRSAIQIEFQYAEKGYKHFSVTDAQGYFFLKHRYSLLYFEAPVKYNITLNRFEIFGGIVPSYAFMSVYKQWFKGNGGTGLSNYAETKYSVPLHGDVINAWDFCLTIGVDMKITNYLYLTTYAERGLIHVYVGEGELNYNISIFSGLKFYPFRN